MLRKLGFVFPICLLPLLSWSFPLTMDIGVFAIDNYSANGNGLPNLSFQIASGQNFHAGANANMPGYSASLGGGTSGPTLALDARDTQVSKAAIINTSSSSGNREFCDFVFYGGHGLPGGVYLGAAGGYGGVFASEFNFGVGYNRWFLGNGCVLFDTPEPPASAWQPAFKGLKALLSFRSAVFDNNMSWNLYNEFWLNWTTRERSLLNAFFDAQTNYGYAHLYPAAGLEPGCLTAKPPTGRIDYCREAFKWVDPNYTPAIAQTDYYYNRIIGSPIY